MSATAAAPAVARRTLRFTSLDEILADADRLAAGPHRTLGNWSFGQILEHLARGIDCFYDGFGFQAPWFARTIIAPLVKRRIMRHGMTSGIRLPKEAGRLLPPDEITVADGLQHLRSSLDRLGRETPTQPHAFFGRLTPEEIHQLMLRHAELHLSLVAPE